MIRRIYDGSRLRLAEDYYSLKTIAALRAYGTDYDFCRFYSSGGGNILLYNSSAVLSGEMTDPEETADFIKINSPDSAECPPPAAALLAEKGSLADEYEFKRRLLFKLIPQRDFDDERFKGIADVPVSLDRMYSVLKSCFGDFPYDLWYADMSHRIRHKVSRAFMCGDGACAAMDFCIGKKAYISAVGTLPEERGKGLGSGLLKRIAAELEAGGAEGFLWCFEDLEGFYSHIGFRQTGEDIILLKKEK